MMDARQVLAMVIASVMWLRSRKPADEPSLAPHAESLGYNNHEMDIYKPVRPLPSARSG